MTIDQIVRRLILKQKIKEAIEALIAEIDPPSRPRPPTPTIKRRLI